MADTEPESEVEHPNEDLQAKMREILDRKNQAARDGEAHLDGHPKAQHTHGREGGPRQFRRKAGA